VNRGKMRPDDDGDYGDLSIRKKPSKSNTTMFILLACGIVGLVLLTCMAGAVIVVVVGEHDRVVPQPAMADAVPQGPEAAKLIGSWKGRLVLRGMDREHLYIFRKDGTLREEVFDLRGVRVSEARWRFRNGQIEIDWPGGGVEIATARWIDDNTMEYRILDHTDVAQNGLVMTFRRQ
jgi:hypothetical protein